MVPLSEVKKGQIVSIRYGRMDNFTKLKIAELGLIQDEPIKILSNNSKGPLLLLCKSSKIMLSRKISKDIATAGV